MSKKGSGFKSTVILGKCLLTHDFYINYYLVSCDLYEQSTLHHVSKCNRMNNFTSMQ